MEVGSGLNGTDATLRCWSPGTPYLIPFDILLALGLGAALLRQEGAAQHRLELLDEPPAAQRTAGRLVTVPRDGQRTGARARRASASVGT